MSRNNEEDKLAGGFVKDKRFPQVVIEPLKKQENIDVDERKHYHRPLQIGNLPKKEQDRKSIFKRITKEHSKMMPRQVTVSAGEHKVEINQLTQGGKPTGTGYIYF